MSLRNITANVNHNRFHKDLCKLLDKHAGHLSKPELLALAAKAVGQIMALQDQRTMTPERAIEIVRINMQLGNEQIVNGAIQKTQGSA